MGTLLNVAPLTVAPVELAVTISLPGPPTIVRELAPAPPLMLAPPPGSGLPLKKSNVKLSSPLPPVKLKADGDERGTCRTKDPLMVMSEYWPSLVTTTVLGVEARMNVGGKPAKSAISRLAKGEPRPVTRSYPVP